MVVVLVEVVVDEVVDEVVEDVDDEVVVGDVAAHTLRVIVVLVGSVLPGVGVCCTTLPFVATLQVVVVVLVTVLNPFWASVEAAAVGV